jgi:hypothetical protein
MAEPLVLQRARSVNVSTTLCCEISPDDELDAQRLAQAFEYAIKQLVDRSSPDTRIAIDAHEDDLVVGRRISTGSVHFEFEAIFTILARRVTLYVAESFEGDSPKEMCTTIAQETILETIKLLDLECYVVKWKFLAQNPTTKAIAVSPSTVNKLARHLNSPREKGLSCILFTYSKTYVEKVTKLDQVQKYLFGIATIFYFESAQMEAELFGRVGWLDRSRKQSGDCVVIHHLPQKTNVSTKHREYLSLKEHGGHLNRLLLASVSEMLKAVPLQHRKDPDTTAFTERLRDAAKLGFLPELIDKEAELALQRQRNEILERENRDLQDSNGGSFDLDTLREPDPPTRKKVQQKLQTSELLILVQDVLYPEVRLSIQSLNCTNISKLNSKILLELVGLRNAVRYKLQHKSANWKQCYSEAGVLNVKGARKDIKYSARYNGRDYVCTDHIDLDASLRLYFCTVATTEETYIVVGALNLHH